MVPCIGFKLVNSELTSLLSPLHPVVAEIQLTQFNPIQMAASVSETLIDESTQESPNSATTHKIEDPNPTSGEEGDAAEEEEGECGFCLFMKGGGCKDSFVAWEKCVEEAEEKNEDVVSKCVEATVLLKKCMEAHSEYYEPVLKAEKKAEEEAVKQLEKEAGGASAESGVGSSEVAE